MIAKLCLSALLVAILAALLSELGFRHKRLFTVLSLVVLISMLADGIGDLLPSLVGFAELGGLSDAAKCAVKAVGLGYVFGFTSDICDELGERGIANAVTVGARIEIFLVIMPYFEKTMQLGIELLK